MKFNRIHFQFTQKLQWVKQKCEFKLWRLFPKNNWTETPAWRRFSTFRLKTFRDLVWLEWVEYIYSHNTDVFFFLSFFLFFFFGCFLLHILSAGQEDVMYHEDCSCQKTEHRGETHYSYCLLSKINNKDPWNDGW